MVWTGIIILLGLVGFTTYLENKNTALERELTNLKKTVQSQNNAIEKHDVLLTSHQEILDGQKDLLLVYKDRLDEMKADVFGPIATTDPNTSDVSTSAHGPDEKQHQCMVEEKQKFEKEVQKKKKTWAGTKKNSRRALRRF